MKYLYLLVTAVAVVAYFFVNTTSVLNPVVWLHPSPLRTLDGVFTPDNSLEKASKLFENVVIAPESLAFDADNERVFASLGDGRVVAIYNIESDHPMIQDFFFVGGFLAQAHNISQSMTLTTPKSSPTSRSLPMDSYHGIEGMENLLSFCNSEWLAKRLPWNVTNEALCG